MEYYARSENSFGKKETVVHHLNRCGKLAGEFADEFGRKADGTLCGLTHDMGKASPLFQKVLSGTEHYVNHWAAGAYFLCKIAGKNRMVKLLSRVVYAHHNKLDYHIDDILNHSLEKDTDDGIKRFSVSGHAQYKNCFEYFLKSIEFSKKPPEVLKISDDENHAFVEMLYMRFMLSCLVDADYSSSAEHFDENYLKKTALPELDCDSVITALNDFRSDICKNSTSDKRINEIRNNVYKDCLRASELPPGLFTLTAPTGSGKTLALLAFALHHAKKNKKKCIIIILPYLTLIEQNAAIYREICPDLLEDHSLVTSLIIPEDEKTRAEITSRWSAPIIITTAVNFFETLFSDDPGELRKLHAFSNSVIVFDECQTLPCSLTDATLNAVNNLCKRYNSSVLFSTATQPSFGHRKDADWKPTEICRDKDLLFSMADRVKVEWRIKNHVCTPFDTIADEMTRTDSGLAIVNKKSHAKKLYQLLCDKCITNEVFHISTDMCASHRIEILNTITKRLKSGLPCRIVSTQCIEAGVDLDVNIVWRALAPLEAIIQSIGRCNRNFKMGMGKAVIYIPDEDDRLYPSRDYESAANILFNLSHKHNDSPDLNDPSVIDDYYRLMYLDPAIGIDKIALTTAVNNRDFETVNKLYKFIPGGGYNVIVPY
ncbi:MAG: CRISPR-associated helicase Cas3' [Eubacteriales bacterium]|nr:CRISPR-associated helicase Cas3' [Eubacteriales bacterium]